MPVLAHVRLLVGRQLLETAIAFARAFALLGREFLPSLESRLRALLLLRRHREPALRAAQQALLLLEDFLQGSSLLPKEVTDHWQLSLGVILVLVVLFAKRGLAGLLPGSKHE